MNRKKILLILICILLAIPAFARSVSYDKLIKTEIPDMMERIPSGSSVCIGEIDSDNPLIARKLRNDVFTILDKAGKNVTDDAMTSEIIKRIENQYTSGMYDEGSLPEIGNMTGASHYIAINCRNLVNHYEVNIQIYNLEKGIPVAIQSFDLKMDSTLIDIMNDNQAVGNKWFSLGVHGGLGIGFSTLHQDMVGTGTRPSESNAVPFIISATAGITGLEYIEFETGLTFHINTGVDVMRSSDKKDALSVRYTTLDIPVQVNIPIVRMPFKLSLTGGGYISLPISKLSVSYLGEDMDNQLDGYVWGAKGGIAASIPLDTGAVSIRAEYFHDFGSFTFENVSEEKTTTTSVCNRRGISIVAGYIYDL